MGLQCNLVSVNDLDHDIPSIDSVPIVNEFLDVFLENFPWLPLFREIDFGIDIEPIKKTNINSSFKNSSSRT